MSEINGIYAASVSILDKNLRLNISKTIKHAENLIDQGCHGIAIFGSTGQSQLISLEEKIKLIEQLSTSKYKENFIIGTGLNSLNDTILLMKVSKSYNFEKLCGYKFSIECVETLAKKYPNQIVGVKDSSYNLYEKLNIDNFSILPGSELKLLKGLQLGCSGIITATCNVTANLSRQVYDNFKNKKDQNHNEKLCNVRAAFDKYNLISGMHTFLSQADNSYNNLLPPLTLLNDSDKKKLFEELNKLNFNLNFLKVA